MPFCVVAPQLGVAVEHNAYPDRLDLNDRNLRLRQGAGMQDRHQHGRPPHFASGKNALWHPPAAPGRLRAEDILNTGQRRGSAVDNCVPRIAEISAAIRSDSE